MWSIFSRARATLIGLGPEDGRTRAVVRSFANVLEHCRQTTNIYDLLDDCLFQKFENGISRFQTLVTRFTECDWKAIQSFFFLMLGLSAFGVNCPFPSSYFLICDFALRRALMVC